jgi:hypothetical protein
LAAGEFDGCNWCVGGGAISITVFGAGSAGFADPKGHNQLI